MSILSVLREECIQIKSEGRSKEEVLRSLAKLAKKCSLLKNVDEGEIYLGLHEREEVASTGLENGVAIPHCFIEGLTDFVVGILIEPDGVDFKAFDGKKTKIFIFMLGPEGERNQHIRYLSNISHTLKDPEARASLIKGSNPASVYEDFLRHAHVDTDADREGTRCLFLVVIQKEELFHPILEIICATDNGGLSIIEADEANSYLYKMPLFASVLNGQTKGFNRIILGEVSRPLANEMIRQIDLETEGLHESKGVMIILLENVMISGALSD